MVPEDKEEGKCDDDGEVDEVRYFTAGSGGNVWVSSGKAGDVVPWRGAFQYFHVFIDCRYFHLCLLFDSIVIYYPDLTS